MNPGGSKAPRGLVETAGTMGAIMNGRNTRGEIPPLLPRKGFAIAAVAAIFSVLAARAIGVRRRRSAGGGR